MTRPPRSCATASTSTDAAAPTATSSTRGAALPPARTNTFQLGQIYGGPRISLPDASGNPATVAAGDDFDTIRTTRGYVSRGATFALTAYGGTGDDKFTVYSNKAELRLEGNDGNDEFLVQAFALADGSGKVSTENRTDLLGGLGDDIIRYNINAPVGVDGGGGFDVSGDVTAPIVSRSLEGTSGVINHKVTSGDGAYDGLLAPGISTTVADATSAGQIIIDQTNGTTIVDEQGATVDTYTVRLAGTPSASVYVNVSAGRTTQEEEAQGDSMLVS